MATAKGQITIVDLNDGRTLSLNLRTSQPLSQIHNVDNGEFTPNWTETDKHQKIFPELYVSGTDGNQILSCDLDEIVVTINGTPIGTSSYHSTYGAKLIISTDSADGNYLDIKYNMVASQYNIVFELKYEDPTTGVATTVKSSTTLTKNDTTGASIRQLLSTPNGYTFNRDSVGSGTISTLSIEAPVYRGSSVDYTDIKHTWYKDGVVIYNGGPTKPANIRFYKITGVSSGVIQYSQISNTDLTSQWTLAAKIEVDADAVDNISIFKVTAEDIEEGSSTEHQILTDAVTLYDMTDPYSVDIYSTTGDTLTPSATSTNLFAQLMQNGEILSDTAIPSTAMFLWKMYDKLGNLVKYYKINNATSGAGVWESVTGKDPDDYKKTKSQGGMGGTTGIVVSKTDITYRAHIVCEVTNI